MTERNTQFKRRQVLQLGAAGAALAGAPFALRLAQAQSTPIKIGFPVPLTGPYSSEAQDQVRCAELAV
jgi:branched-chain amino acid transport system substrate-binding protein